MEIQQDAAEDSAVAERLGIIVGESMTIRFHEKLGGLVPRSEDGEFISFAEFLPGKPVELRVYLGSSDLLTTDRMNQYALWLEAIANNERNLREAITTEYYQNYVDNWAEETPLSRGKFFDAHDLQFITFSEDSAEAYYPSEPYLGHYLVVEMERPPEISDVSMFG